MLALVYYQRVMKLLLTLILIAATNGFAAEPPTTREQSQEKPKTQAGKPAKKTLKTRSLKELIAYTEKVGKPGKIDDVEFEPLGFRSEMAAKDLVYRLSGWPNWHQRWFVIVYDTASKPTSLVWHDERATKKDEIKSLKVWYFVSSLGGELQSAAYMFEENDDAGIAAREVDDSVRQSFHELVAFFKTDAVSLTPLEGK